MSDCLIVGGGVIGLSLAYDLAGHGLQVRLIDAGQPGREASWAGAGILPPACAAVDDPLEQLTALSNALHAQWSEELRASTGIDNGLSPVAAPFTSHGIARMRGNLTSSRRRREARSIVAQRLTPAALVEVEPALRPQGSVEAAYLVPAECQIRNPRHLKALLIACADRGVEITSGAAAEDFEVRSGFVRAVNTNLGPIRADRVCITTGSWTLGLAKKLSVAPAIKPIRGQIVLLSTARKILSRIVNEGSRYLVPRCDGRLLIGSTEEDVGFDRGTTAGAVAELLQFAIGLVPELETRKWSGTGPVCVRRPSMACPTWDQFPVWKTRLWRPDTFAAVCSDRPEPRW